MARDGLQQFGVRQPPEGERTLELVRDLAHLWHIAYNVQPTM